MSPPGSERPESRSAFSRDRIRDFGREESREIFGLVASFRLLYTCKTSEQEP